MRPPLIREEGGVLLFTLDDPGALNEGQASGLRQSLYGDLESREAPLVAVDLGKIDYISSTGIALMIGIKRRVDSRMGHVVLFALQAEVLELLKIMKLESLFQIAADEPGAIDLLRSLPSE